MEHIYPDTLTAFQLTQSMAYLIIIFTNMGYSSTVIIQR